MRAREVARNDDGAAVILWILLLTVFVLVPLGATGISLWQAFSNHLALSAAADAAPVAGANGIDANAYRQGHVLQLDPARAEELAAETLEAQTDLPGIAGADIHAEADHIVVVIRGRASLGLLDTFAGGPLEFTVAATGKPHLRP